MLGLVLSYAATASTYQGSRERIVDRKEETKASAYRQCVLALQTMTFSLIRHSFAADYHVLLIWAMLQAIKYPRKFSDHWSESLFPGLHCPGRLLDLILPEIYIAKPLFSCRIGAGDARKRSRGGSKIPGKDSRSQQNHDWRVSWRKRGILSESHACICGCSQLHRQAIWCGYQVTAPHAGMLALPLQKHTTWTLALPETLSF